jgi:hypothetical protein
VTASCPALGQPLLRCLNSGIGQSLLHCLNSGIGQSLLHCLNSGIHAYQGELVVDRSPEFGGARFSVSLAAT